MNRAVKTGLVCTMSVVIVFLAVQVKRKQDQKERIGNNLKTLPDCTVTDRSGHALSLRSFKDKPLLLMAFDPNCEHCDYSVDGLRKHVAELAAAHVMLITSADSAAVEAFAVDQKLDRYSAIHVCRSEPGVFYETFGSQGVPAFFIYNPSGILLKTFRGEWKTEVLISFMNKAP